MLQVFISQALCTGQDHISACVVMKMQNEDSINLEALYVQVFVTSYDAHVNRLLLAIWGSPGPPGTKYNTVAVTYGSPTRRYSFPWAPFQNFRPTCSAYSYCMLPMMAFVKSDVLELPPKSPVRCLPSAMVPSTALCTPADDSCLSVTETTGL